MAGNQRRFGTGDGNDDGSDDGVARGEPDEATRARADEYVARIDLLEAENRQLRTRLRDTRSSEYRQAAVGFGLLGIAALGGAVVFLDLRAVLLALGGIGLFSAVLTYYLTPETFLAASTAERVYHALALNGETLVDDLGLEEAYVYVPTAAGSPGGTGVKVFVPQSAEYEVPAADDLDAAFVGVEDEHIRGLALFPTGGALFREFLEGRTEPLADDPEALGEQLATALVDVFELVERVSVEADDRGGRLTVGVGESVYGPYDRFDHPVVSLLATGLARQLGVPVRAAVLPESDGRHDAVLSLTWSPSDDVESPSDDVESPSDDVESPSDDVE